MTTNDWHINIFDVNSSFLSVKGLCADLVNGSSYVRIIESLAYIEEQAIGICRETLLHTTSSVVTPNSFLGL